MPMAVGHIWCDIFGGVQELEYLEEELIKSNDGDNKATQKKKAIMSKITTQVDEVKDSKVGHLIVKFADKEKLETVRKEFEENMDEVNISVVEKEKLKPKIKVCNVDTDVDNVIEDIKERNKWINDCILYMMKISN